MILKKIEVTGNKKTKNFAILRELNIHPGDTISKEERREILEKNRLLVYNTQLFNVVKIQDSIVGTQWFWRIYVEERWYVFPITGLDIEEQNITQWLKNPSLQRVTLWLGVSHSNFTGRNDFFFLNTKLGYTQGTWIGYRRPFLFPKRKIDATFSLRYERNREIISYSDSGRLQRTKLYEHFARQTSEVFVELRKRISQYKFTYVSFFARNYFVHDSILLDNPYYTGIFRRQQTLFLQNEYKYRLDTRDLRPYPSKGNFMEVQVTLLANSFRHYGIGTEIYFSHHTPLYKNRWIHSASLRLQYFSLRQTPFPLKYRLDKIKFRGFQNNYIDGNFVTAFQQEVRYGIIPRRIRNVSWFPKAVRHFPFGIYLFGFTDGGYIFDNTSSRLDISYKKRILYSYGLGLDVIGFYDIVLRAQIIRNNFGKYGAIFDTGIYIR